MTKTEANQIANQINCLNSSANAKVQSRKLKWMVSFFVVYNCGKITDPCVDVPAILAFGGEVIS